MMHSLMLQPEEISEIKQIMVELELSAEDVQIIAAKVWGLITCEECMHQWHCKEIWHIPNSIVIC